MEEGLRLKGAVVIEGTKWSGKSTTAERFAKTILLLGNSEILTPFFQLGNFSYEKLLKSETPLLIDEWQLLPTLWDAVRYQVDHRKRKGQFILTGSATPRDPREIMHSGIGRIARIKIRTMSLWESGDSNGLVSLASLFEGEKPFAESSLDLERLSFLTCRGRWPESITLRECVALRLARFYYEDLISRVTEERGGIKRNEVKLSFFLEVYAKSQGEYTTLRTIARDIGLNIGASVSEKTLVSYINAMENLFVIEELHAWTPHLRSTALIRVSPARFFSDSSIGTAALKIVPADLMEDGISSSSFLSLSHFVILGYMPRP